MTGHGALLLTPFVAGLDQAEYAAEHRTTQQLPVILVQVSCEARIDVPEGAQLAMEGRKCCTDYFRGRPGRRVVGHGSGQHRVRKVAVEYRAQVPGRVSQLCQLPVGEHHPTRRTGAAVGPDQDIAPFDVAVYETSFGPSHPDLVECSRHIRLTLEYPN